MSNPMTQRIAEIIERMLSQNGGELELQRNKLATLMGCVPSQINYVITSRFSADRGYIVESRRGGGGYVRITKVSFSNHDTRLMHTLAAVGDEIDLMSARAVLLSLYEGGLINEREFQLVFASLSDRALNSCPAPLRDAVRSEMLKSVILTLRTNKTQN